MTIKTRLAQLEAILKKTEPRKILYYVHGEQTLEEAKTALGWEGVPDHQIKVICYRVIE